MLRALIVGGDIPPVISLLGTLSRDNSTPASAIVVTAVDRAQQSQLQRAVSSLVERNHSPSLIKVRPLDQALADPPTHFSHIFVTPPLRVLERVQLGKTSVADAVIDGWTKATHNLPILVQMRAERSEEPDRWNRFAGTSRFVAPAEICAAYNEMAERYAERLQCARNACRNCATSRSLGLLPRYADLTAHPELYVARLTDSRPISAVEYERTRRMLTEFGVTGA